MVIEHVHQNYDRVDMELTALGNCQLLACMIIEQSIFDPVGNPFINCYVGHHGKGDLACGAFLKGGLVYSMWLFILF